jgi:hypothetical protein
MLYYENTKLRRRRREEKGRQGLIYRGAKALVVSGIRIRQVTCTSTVTSPPPLKKACPQALFNPLIEKKEKRREKKGKYIPKRT